MRPNTHFRYYDRRFLNLPGFHSRAYVIASVADSAEVEQSGDPYWGRGPGPGHVRLEIADCNEFVALTLKLDSEFENSIFKVDQLIEALTGLRQAMIDEKEAWTARDEEKKREQALEEKRKEARVETWVGVHMLDGAFYPQEDEDQIVLRLTPEGTLEQRVWTYMDDLGAVAVTAETGEW